MSADVIASFPAPKGNGRLVNVGTHRLYINCLSNGSPAVVMDAGLDDSSQSWSQIQGEVARFTRACIYDRAGLGQGEPCSTPRSTADIVRDLHTLLHMAGVPGPYVLVGHSFSGLTIRLYAHQYPHDVAGLVFVDASHPDVWQRVLELLPPATCGEPEALTKDRCHFQARLNDEVTTREGINWKLSAAQVRAMGALGDVPLVVLSAGILPPFHDTYPAAIKASLTALLQDLQRDLTRLSTNSTHIIAEQSGHSIQHDRPELVIEAIRRVVEMLRRK